MYQCKEQDVKTAAAIERPPFALYALDILEKRGLESAARRLEKCK